MLDAAELEWNGDTHTDRDAPSPPVDDGLDSATVTISGPAPSGVASLESVLESVEDLPAWAAAAHGSSPLPPSPRCDRDTASRTGSGPFADDTVVIEAGAVHPDAVAADPDVRRDAPRLAGQDEPFAPVPWWVARKAAAAALEAREQEPNPERQTPVAPANPPEPAVPAAASTPLAAPPRRPSRPSSPAEHSRRLAPVRSARPARGWWMGGAAAALCLVSVGLVGAALPGPWRVSPRLENPTIAAPAEVPPAGDDSAAPVDPVVVAAKPEMARPLASNARATASARPARPDTRRAASVASRNEAKPERSAPALEPTPLAATSTAVVSVTPALPAAAQPRVDRVEPEAAFEATQVDVKPEVLRRVPPEYPEHARARGIEDVVIVRVLVSAAGAPAGVRLLRGARNDSAFDEAALAAVRQWRFSPARRRQAAVSCWFNVAVPFRTGGPGATPEAARPTNHTSP
jgi:protein TonB